jgi:hypothetical protein
MLTKSLAGFELFDTNLNNDQMEYGITMLLLQS